MFAKVVAFVAVVGFITKAISSVLNPTSTDSEKGKSEYPESLTSEAIQNVTTSQNVMVAQDTTTIQNVNVNVCVEKASMEEEYRTSMLSEEISVGVEPGAPEPSVPDVVQNITTAQNVMAVQDTTAMQSVNVNIYVESAPVEPEPHGPMSPEGITIKVVPGAETPETPRRTARLPVFPSPSPERISSGHTPPRRRTPQPSDSPSHLSPESKGRRRSSTSSRRSVSPQASNRARPYDRATPIDLSSHEEPRNGRLIRQQSKIRDQEAYIYWYETSSEKPLEGPPLVLLEDLELADGYFFVNWTDAIYWQAWRYQDADKSWKKMIRGDSGDQGKDGKEPRYFVVTPNTGVPSFVSRTNYMSKYNVMGYM